jgi:hypothetical protein
MNVELEDTVERSESDSCHEVKAAWSKEIERRVREIDGEAVDLVDWQDVRAELFADQ